MSPGRNDPCPCGSGKKYKRCHLAIERSEVQESQAIHSLDHALTWRIDGFAAALLGEDYLGFDPADADDTELQYLMTFTQYNIDLDGRSLAEWFFEAENESLTSREREWLEAKIKAWISVWDVETVNPGRGAGLRDLLTGQRREVLEISASKEFVVHYNILARIVDFGGRSYITGMHPHPLRPLDGSRVVDQIRRRLRVKNRLTPARLRSARAARVVSETWDDVLDSIFERALIGPEFQNTDGEPLLLVTDRFAFAPDDRGAVTAAIRNLPGAQPEDDETVVLLRSDTVVATISVAKQSMKVETNSLRRADSAVQAIESACDALIRHRGRDLVDPRSESARVAARGARSEETPTVEMMEIARQWKQEHYASWPDIALPALGGKTPARQRARSEDANSSTHCFATCSITRRKSPPWRVSM